MALSKRQQTSINRVRSILSEQYPTFEGKNFNHIDETVIFDLTCKTCQNIELRIKYKSFQRRKNKCQNCDKKYKGGCKPVIDIKEFDRILKIEGWEIDPSDRSTFKNSKSEIQVLNPKGDKSKTSYSRFKSGRGRSKSDNINNLRSDYSEVKKIFKEKGYLLLTKEYINNKTPMECQCEKCGTTTKSTFKAMKNFSKKCKTCGDNNKVKNWNDINNKFQEFNFQVLSKPDDYINSYTPLDIKCSKCENQIQLSWSKFRRNTRINICPICPKY